VSETACFNSSLESGYFPDSLTLADIISCHKKDSSMKKTTTPISLLSCIAEVYEEILAGQLNDLLDSCLSKHLCIFENTIAPKSAMLNMQIKVRLEQYNVSVEGFDCLPHDLIISKLHAYGMRSGSLKFLYWRFGSHLVTLDRLMLKTLNLV